jgi:hypothetical protein
MPLLLTLPAAVQAQFTYTSNNGAITITGYTGPGGAVTIPGMINGLPVTSIGYRAFAYCDFLTSIMIPNSVTNIGDLAFGSYSLNSITVDRLNPVYISVDGVLFDKGQTTLIQYPEGKAGSYAVPNSVTSIGSAAFRDCGLLSVTIPDSVTDIWSESFDSCTSLTNVTIPDSVTSIGYAAFRDCGLLSVTIPDSITDIGYGAFMGCTSLTSVTIPNSVTNIGGGVAGCTATGGG